MCCNYHNMTYSETRCIIISQMIAILALIIYHLDVPASPLSVCNKVLIENPCALLPTGCLCIPEIAWRAQGDLAKNCVWSKPVCSSGEKSLLFDRHQGLTKWLREWNAMGISPGACFDYDKCIRTVSPLIEPNATLSAMHQLGTFYGPEGWCAFAGLTTHHVSKNILSLLFISPSTVGDISTGLDGNSLFATLRSCAVRTHIHPRVLVYLTVAAQFAPGSSTMSAVYISDAIPDATWLKDTGFLTVATSSLWRGTRVGICGAQQEPEVCDGCGENVAVAALLAEINPSKYCDQLLSMRFPAASEYFPTLRHARVCSSP